MDRNKRVITAQELIERAKKGGNEELALKLLGNDGKISLDVIDVISIGRGLFKDRDKRSVAPIQK